MVSRIDPATNAVVATIETGAGAHDLLIDDNGVWITNYQANTVSRIDPATNTVVATIEGVGSGVGIAAGDGDIFVSTRSGGVSRIDPATNKARESSSSTAGPTAWPTATASCGRRTPTPVSCIDSMKLCSIPAGDDDWSAMPKDRSVVVPLRRQTARPERRVARDRRSRACPRAHTIGARSPRSRGREISRTTGPSSRCRPLHSPMEASPDRTASQDALAALIAAGMVAPDPDPPPLTTSGAEDCPPLRQALGGGHPLVDRRHGKEPQGLARKVRVNCPGRHGYSALAVDGDFERRHRSDASVRRSTVRCGRPGLRMTRSRSSRG